MLDLLTSFVRLLLLANHPRSARQKKRINLKDAITIEYADHFVIQTPITGAKVHPSSTFTQDDIDALICGCAGSSGATPSNSIEVPRSQLLSGAQTFSLPANTTVLAYALLSSGSAGVTPTLTTADGTRALRSRRDRIFRLRTLYAIRNVRLHIVCWRHSSYPVHNNVLT